MGDKKLIDFEASLASTTHDMKNSLGMMLNSLDEVVNNCTAENCPSHKHLLHMQYEANRVNNNLIQLLTLYKMDNDQLSMNISHYSVSDLLEETHLQCRPLLEYKDIKVTVDCPDDLYWFFDRNLVLGVINNVLNNAFRYAGDRIVIKADEHDGCLVISVVDNGKGYPESMVGSSVKTNKEVSFKSGSTGLGLFFASMVAMMHKNKDREGYISLSNIDENGGGCFSIILP
jgi:two-component system sensor histidine kinase SenX3